MSDANWSQGFSVAVGSVAGREHARVHRNNQDGLAVRVEPERIVAALCDGCSSGRSSEVGARLGAAWIVAQLPRILADCADESTLAERLATDLVAYLRQIAAGVGGDDRAVHDHLLFTILVAVVEPERTVVLGLGDGLYAVDGERRILDSGPRNAPAYLAYRLVDPARLDGPVDLRPRVHVRTGAARSLVLGSDGAAEMDLTELDEPRYARNPSLLQKRLNVLERHFADDASLILITRKETP